MLVRPLLPRQLNLALYPDQIIPLCNWHSCLSSLEASVSLWVDSLRHGVCILWLSAIWLFWCVEYETGILPTVFVYNFQLPPVLGVMILRPLIGFNYSDQPHLGLPQHTW